MSPHEENEDVSGNQHDSTLLLPQLGSTLLALLDDLPPSLPILVLSTAHVESAALPLPARTALISSTAALLPLNSTSTSSSSSSPSSSSSYPSQRAVERTGLCELALPTADARATFLHNLLDDVVASIHEAAAAAEKGQPADEQAPALEELPLAPKVDVANVAGGGAAASGSSVRDAATREEERKMLKREHTLRELRICLSRCGEMANQQNKTNEIDHRLRFMSLLSEVLCVSRTSALDLALLSFAFLFVSSFFHALLFPSRLISLSFCTPPPTSPCKASCTSSTATSVSRLFGAR